MFGKQLLPAVVVVACVWMVLPTLGSSEEAQSLRTCFAQLCLARGILHGRLRSPRVSPRLDSHLGSAAEPGLVVSDYLGCICGRVRCRPGVSAAGVACIVRSCLFTRVCAGSFQIHVTYSSQFHGAGILAGGPYWCANDNLGIALSTCMNGTVRGRAGGGVIAAARSLHSHTPASVWPAHSPLSLSW